MMPVAPGNHSLAVLALALLALILFTNSKIRLETSSLIVLVALCFLFEFFPYVSDGKVISSYDLFLGFGHEALIAVCALMIVGQGLVKTGALVPLGRIVAKLWKVSPLLSLALTLVFGALGSAFVNNTPIVVLLIPVLVNVAQRNNTSVAPTLMPMNFSTLLGGTCTTIGTSTNLLVVGVAADLGLQKFSMFDFVVPGAIAGSVGLLYLWLLVPLMFRNRKPIAEKQIEREFVFQLQFEPDSKSIGRSIADLQSSASGKLSIMKIRKAGNEYGDTGTSPLPDATIEENDRITLRGSIEDITEFEDVLDAITYSKIEDGEALDHEVQLSQVVIMENSRLVNSTLANERFADSVDLKIVAIHRIGYPITALPEGVGKVVLRAGDVLLAQGTESGLQALRESGSLLVLDEKKVLPLSKRGPLSISILALAVILAATGLLPIATSALGGVLLMLISKCIDWKDVERAISVPVVMIVVVSLALGKSLTDTGTTLYLAQWFLYLLDGYSAAAVLSALILFMAVMTNIVSNNAAAVIGTPIAISMATSLNVPPEAFVLAVLFGANLSFVTPMAYKTNVLVMSAGSYRFSDFVMAGLPLTVLLWLTYSLLLPRIYGF